MTSKTTAKANRKTATRTARKKSNRINRQRRLQKQLQIIIFERHSRRCIICHHPDREAIEEEFVHWRAPWKLSQDYKLNDYRTVYRHARAAGLLLQRRERLHSALDAFVESVDDVTFTGDTILRAMRAYSCIDSHGRWTEIPTQVQFSTSTDAHPPQPSPRGTHVGSDVIDIDFDEESENDTEDDAEENAENAPEERVTALDVLNVFRKYGVQASRNDATAAEDQYDEPEDDDSDADTDPDDDDESEEDAENEFEELVTASDVLNVVRKYANQTSRSDATDAADESEETAENELEKLVTSRLTSSKSPSRSDATACSVPPKIESRSDATACADSPAQALPRDVIRGQNPNDRSPSDRTDCAAPPVQPAVPPKPKPDADGRIWHPRPGYPDQEISEPDAQGRVAYKIHMMTAAPRPPSRETDAQRAAKLIYRSVIKNHGNP